MLNVRKMMGTTIGRRRQMQDIKDGKATCVLKGKFTEVRPGTKHVAFHAGAGMRKATDWPAQENLVAHLRNWNGSCVMGPYTDADELLRASEGGYRFKLGTGVTREVLQAMLAKKRQLYVYMFYPAEVCKDLVWNDAPTLAKVDWDYFVYCMRSDQPTVEWFYSVKEKTGGMPVMENASSVLMDYASVLATGAAGPGAVDFHAVAGSLLNMPVADWNVMDAVRLREAVDASVLDAAAMVGPESRAWAMGTPVYATESTRAMIREAQAACMRFQRDAVAGGIDEGRLRAVGTMGLALEGIEAAMDAGGMALGVSLSGLMTALSEYGWAMEEAGIPRADIDRVQTVWQAIEALQRRVLMAARNGGDGVGGEDGVVGPVPL
jgi:hypothetical protein